MGGGDFTLPFDPRLTQVCVCVCVCVCVPSRKITKLHNYALLPSMQMQSSSLGLKHSHPGSPTSTSSLGPPLKKQAQRGPLLPTPEGPYMRQGLLFLLTFVVIHFKALLLV